MAGPIEETQGEVGWFCVRCVLRVGGDSASQLSEERLTLWRAEGFDEAIGLAEDEASGYAAEQPDLDIVGLSQAYRLFFGPRHGAEVFSLLRASDLDPSAYLTRFFDTGEGKQGDTDPGT
ncbi:hypothetical protein KIF24_09640 [Micromonospora sp. Llam7]|uniref:hypothetical protein n=1 Tax=Micromonospora tarapacensis TaxID=2835305 RepID=UPI001C83D462|nr:hypothetical protein [Micromonospora tarapacensis]MBX7266255.1 hypothetical protein [Micromonospora tarapacensis]